MLKHTDIAADSGAATTPRPFVYRRAITWGDTDPGDIVFTGRFLEYAVDATEAWVKHTFGLNWYEMKHDRGLGTPYRFANLDFKAPLTPRDVLEVEVRVTHVGTTSIRLDLQGYGVSEKERRLAFTCDEMLVLVDVKTIKKTPIPDDFRAKLATAQA
ncbi:MAG TPA: thioesterase family protein [Hyphomicrobiales bacterium]|nr:thioesterase family protein [Hyphomicrobiales bacterium]